SIYEDDLNETARLVRDAGRRAHPIVAAVSDASAVQAAVSPTADELARIHLAVHNAGLEPPPTPREETGHDVGNRLTAGNLTGVFLAMKHEIPPLRESGGRAIVKLSSGGGVVGISGQAAYAATKHGVIGMTKSAALVVAAEGIRINAICPGIIETPMMGRFSGGTPEGRARVIAQEPVGRMGRPEEIASAALWLCSDLGGFAVSHALVVDGGQTVGIS